jgi:hypothetical protein
MKITSIIRNRRVVLGTLACAAALAVGIPVANAASAPSAGSQPTGTASYACVSAAGHLDYFEYQGKLPHKCWLPGEHLWSLANAVPGAPVSADLKGIASVATGGPFVANSTEVGTVSLKAGTYLVSVNAKATPNVNSATPVFPSFFVYNQAKNAAFAGDLFNIGSGALAAGSTSLDSYYSGSEVVTLASDTVLHVYAFGYSPGGAAGSYALDDLTVNAVPVP